MKNKTTPTHTFWSYLFILTNAFGSDLESLGLEDFGEELFGKQSEEGQSEFREGDSASLKQPKKKLLALYVKI